MNFRFSIDETDVLDPMQHLTSRFLMKLSFSFCFLLVSFFEGGAFASDESRQKDTKELSSGQILSSESDLPKVRLRLQALRKEPTGSIHAVFKMLREQHEKSMAREDFDLYQALLRFPKKDGPGYKTCLQIEEAIVSLTQMGTTDAARELAQIVDDHDHLFRPEISRQIAKFGVKALPALIESRKSTPDRKRWASLQLDAMGKRTPGEAVQVQDSLLLAEILTAFARIQDNDAISVVLSFVNSEKVQVRTAARTALKAYGQEAIWKVKEAYTVLTGKSPREGVSVEELTSELYAAYDLEHSQEVDAMMEEGVAFEKENKWEEAIATYDRILALEPLYEKRAAMIPAYLHRARDLAQKEMVDEALALYRKSLFLSASDSKDLIEIRSQVAYLEGQSLLKKGVADESLFREALRVDPNHVEAKKELERLGNDVEARSLLLRKFAMIGSIVMLAFSLFLFWSGKKKGQV